MRVGVHGQQRMLSADDDAALSRLQEDAQVADMAFRRFRLQQVEHDASSRSFATAKAELRHRLDGLDRQQDGILARRYGLSDDWGAVYATWHDGHQPFHWSDRVLRNHGEWWLLRLCWGIRPTLNMSKVKSHYRALGYSTEVTGNLYALMLERSYALLSPNARFGMIVPLSLSSTDRMAPLRAVTERCFAGHMAHPLLRRRQSVRFVRRCEVSPRHPPRCQRWPYLHAVWALSQVVSR